MVNLNLNFIMFVSSSHRFLGDWRRVSKNRLSLHYWLVHIKACNIISSKLIILESMAVQGCVLRWYFVLIITDLLIKYFIYFTLQILFKISHFLSGWFRWELFGINGIYLNIFVTII